MGKIVIQNGKIYSLDCGFNLYSTMLIEDGIIGYLGDKNLLLKGQDGVTCIDLGQRIAMPAFYDSHVHIIGVGRQSKQLDLYEVESKDELRGRLKRKVEETAPGTWIVGAGWKKDLWSDYSFPSKEDIDPVSKENPVALYSKDRHTILLNTFALKELGIKGDTTFEGPGEIVTDSMGLPTGILKEDACNLFRKRTAELEDIEQTLSDAFSTFFENGITSVDTMSDSEECPKLFGVLQEMEMSGELPLRVDFYFPLSALDALVNCRLHSDFGGNYLKIGGVKIFADGALGSQTAHLIEPYCDNPENFGLSTISQEELSYHLKVAARNNIRCAIHAIGDGAVNKVINGLLEVKRSASGGFNPSVGLRHRIEHLQLIQPADIPRLRESGAVASVQPIHLLGDIDIARRYWGGRCKNAYPYKSLLDAGIPMIMGSDAPVEDMNPLKGIYAAITRRRLNEREDESFHPEQKMMVRDAIMSYTIIPHEIKGSRGLGAFMVGNLADVVVLSGDIFEMEPEEILETRIDYTICGGKIVYERK